MFYTGVPQNSLRVLIDDEKTIKALNLKNNININNVVVHAHIINLCNSNNFIFNVKILKE